MRFLLLAAAALVAVPLAAAPADTGRAASSAKPTYGDFGFDMAGMDRATRPGTDFGRYANGGYEDRLVIPEDRASFGMFNVLRDLSQTRTRGLIEAAAAADAPAGSETRKIGDYYASFMDTAAIEAKGLSPITPQLAAIHAIDSRDGIAAMFATFNRDGVDAPVAVRFRQDLKDPRVFSVYLSQGGLGLPDRDYYLDQKNPKFAEARAAYQTYIAQMFTLAGIPDAAAPGRGGLCARGQARRGPVEPCRAAAGRQDL